MGAVVTGDVAGLELQAGALLRGWSCRGTVRAEVGSDTRQLVPKWR